MKNLTLILNSILFLITITSCKKDDDKDPVTPVNTEIKMTWQKCLGGTSTDGANSIERTIDGGYIIAAHSMSSNGDLTGVPGGNDLWIIKVDGSGNIQWQKRFGGTYPDDAKFIHQTMDGGYIFAGSTASNDGDVTGNNGGQGNVEVWIVKLDGSGNIEWQKCLGGSQSEYAESIRQTLDGGYIIAGTTNSNDGDISGNHGGMQDAWIVKIDNIGNVEWQKCLGGTNWDIAASIQQTSDGGFIFAGSTYSNDGNVSGHNGNNDLWIVKMDGSGNIAWQKCLGGSGYDAASSIQQTIDGGYIVAGSTSSNDGDVSGSHGGLDYWVVKINGTGSIQWQKCLGGTNLDESAAIQKTSDGYIVAGNTESNDGDVTGNHGDTDSWIVKLSESGDVLWKKCFGGTDTDYAKSIVVSNEGGYVFTATTYSNDGDVSGNHIAPGGTGGDVWLVKLK